MLGTAASQGAATTDPSLTAASYDAKSDQFLVVWTDQRAGLDAYARRVGIDGVPQGSAFEVESGTSDQVAVTVSRRADPYGVLITYTDDRSGNWDLFASRPGKFPYGDLNEETPS